MKSNILVIINRLLFLLKFYKSVSIYAGLAFIICSILFFQENQVLGSAVALSFIHLYRKDYLLIQIAYGERYKLILFFEYLLLYLFYVVIGILVNDPLISYSLLVFLIIITFLYLLRPAYKYSRHKVDILTSIIDKNDFIWRAGLRHTQFKFLLIYLFFLPLMIGTKNIYIYSFMLFSIFIVVFNFYLHEISYMYLGIINVTIKKSLIKIYKKNIMSFLNFLLLPTIIQICLFYDNKMILYSISSLGICFLLIFQFLCVNLHTYNNKRSITLMQLLNGFSVIAILIPPLGIILAAYSFKLFNKLR